MATFNLLLRRKKRRMQIQLFQFISQLNLYVKGGYELKFAWEKTCKIGSSQFDELGGLKLSEQEFMMHKINSLSQHFPLLQVRPWFVLLGELYKSGASLSPFLTAFSRALLSDEKCERNQHANQLTKKVQILLLLCFLPAALLLIFSPLLTALWALPD